MKRAISQRQWRKYVTVFLMLCILVGIVLHIVPYFYNRSLWIDEAMLASSICTRSFSELVASPLDWGQSSAIGYLFIVKVITTVFGTSETALRIWSLISSFGCIALVYLLLKDKVSKNWALFITAFFSLTDRYIYYGNELKPYMSDNLCCLIALYIWQKYKEKKIALWQMVVLFSILIWFSFTSVFFIAGCMIIECFSLFKKWLKEKNTKFIQQLGVCAIVLVSFALNYVLWLSKTAGNAGGSAYWDMLKFPLVPTSISDIKLIINMTLQFWAFYSRYIAAVFVFLVLIYTVFFIKRKKDSSHVLVPFVLSLLLLLIASYCGFYPIQDRLVQVYAIVVIIIAGYGCNEIEKSSFPGKNNHSMNGMTIFYYGILAGCLAITGMSSCKNIFSQHVYISGSEVEESMEYLEKNLTGEDVVYVNRFSIPVYTYEMDYQVTYSDLNNLPKKTSKIDELSSALPYQIDNTIYGQSLITYLYQIPYSYESKENPAAIQEDADMIMKNQSVYIFTSHDIGGFPKLIEILEGHGTVETVVNSHDTYLYHFVRSDS